MSQMSDSESNNLLLVVIVFRMKLPAYFATASLLGLTILLSSCDDIYSTTVCPCHYDDNTQRANCFHKGLDTVPECVPNTTHTLDFGVNNLVYRSMQFVRFSSLTELDLTGNPIGDPGNDSFIGLSEVRVLKLDNCGLTNVKSYFFNGLSNLRNLSLELNAIEVLTADVFTNIPKLTKLELNFNRIQHVDGYVFAGLTDLHSLDLSQNPSYQTYSEDHPRYMRFEYQSFAGLSALEILSLRNITIFNSTAFPTDIFQPLKSLQNLNLIKFCRSYVTGDYDCPNLNEHLSNVPSVQQLQVDIERIEQLGPGFESMSNLTEIYFTTIRADFQVQTLSNKTFEHLKDTQVSKLTLDAWHLVQINNIMPFTFSVLKNLKKLDFSFRSEFCDSAFNNFFVGLDETIIKSLRISVKCLSENGINPKIMESFMNTELDSLDLSYSSITRISDENIFNKLPKTLRTLNLQGNSIKSVNFKSLIHLENLLLLDLSHQNQEGLVSRRSAERKKRMASDSEGNGSSSTTKPVILVNEQQTSPTVVDCYPLPFRLQSIDISHSLLLDDILKTFCSANNSLTKLDVSNQFWKPLESVDDQVMGIWKPLEVLHKLEDLNLDGNRIKTIPSDAFTQQTFLKRLSIQNNVLTKLTFAVDNLVNLELLDSSDNAIQYASDRFMSQIETLSNQSRLSIRLDNNPLICDCDRMAFVQWLNDTKAELTKTRLSCKYINGSEISLGHVSDILDLLQTDCPSEAPSGVPYFLIFGCVAGGVIVLLLVGIAILIRKNRIQAVVEGEDNVLIDQTARL